MQPLESLPRVTIGWVLAADVVDPAVIEVIDRARKEMRSVLETQFPEFDWQLPMVERRAFPPLGALDALPLLELGVLEKSHRKWDYALVVVPNELDPRHRAYTMAVPSSALEVGVMSTARLDPGPGRALELAGLALHVWGHLAGLGHDDAGPMHPPDEAMELTPSRYPDQAAEALRERLADVADLRLEERQERWGRLRFYWQTFWADPKGLLSDIVASRPWQMPLYLGRLTAAAAVSTVFLLLTSDAWQIGVAVPAAVVWWSTALAIMASTAFVFLGQNVGQVGREARWSEQTARSRLVIFGTLLLGMISLWVVLLAVAAVATALVPAEVAADWTGLPRHAVPLGRYAAFVATIGVLAASLGGNLEEEDELKAELLFDEET